MRHEILYGRNSIRECLRAGRRRAHKLYLAENTGQVDDLIDLAGQRNIPILTLPRNRLTQLAQTRHHQGVALETDPYPYIPLETLLASIAEANAPLLLALDCLQDPQNVGSLLRTAEAVQVHGILLQERRAVGITPSVVKASAGATEHLQITRVTNLARTLNTLQQRGFWVVGLEGQPDLPTLWETDLHGPLVLVVGSEGQGMRRLVREHCDILASLPMHGQINSLNAAVAGSIALYEVIRQRRQSP